MSSTAPPPAPIKLWYVVSSEADDTGRAARSVKRLRPLKHWDRGFEPHSKGRYLSAIILCLRCPVQVAALRQGWSPVQGVLPTVSKIHSSRIIVTGNRPESLIRAVKGLSSEVNFLDSTRRKQMISLHLIDTTLNCRHLLDRSEERAVGLLGCHHDEGECGSSCPVPS
jgi:hypothetical protein